MSKVSILVGDCLTRLKQLPDDSVQCCVTSPPYWGLRDYGNDGQSGLESTPAEFVAAMVAVFDEVRRVLRPDGCCFVNLGDSYAGSGGYHAEHHNSQSGFQQKGNGKHKGGRAIPVVGKLKPKDLCGIPWRVAFALQDSGWWLRQDIIWHKPNPMPESVTDRCTKAHEYIFLLTKSARYFWDADSVREGESHQRKGAFRVGGAYTNGQSFDNSAVVAPTNSTTQTVAGGRNARSVWTITTKPYSGAHFATFPPELPMRCIGAGSSQKGCCPQCGAPWVRVVERGNLVPPASRPDAMRCTGNSEETQHQKGSAKACFSRESKTTGWEPTCDCSAANPFDPAPCAILDPFFGAGTTGLVAMKMGRDCIGVELNPDYAEIARKRIADACGLFGSVEVQQ